MKKIALSVLVIVTFAAYSLNARLDQNKTVATPSSLQTAPSDSPTTQPAPVSATKPASEYKDGSYVGVAADAFYGYIQVKVTVSSGKISTVDFLQYPNDRSTSVRINRQAMPYLKQEAIKAQSAKVDGVSGATDTSQAFVQSLASALDKART